MTNSYKIGNSEHNPSGNQTIFLATRMDLLAQIFPKREKPKRVGNKFVNRIRLSGLQAIPTIH